ncbi:MAG: BLUF domain-containing protein [Pacificimonas sp.]
MRQIIYISTARALQSAADLDLLLAKSRMRNEALGLTGLLLYNGVRYLQVLEGRDDIVGDRFDHIASDSRHRSIVMLSDRQIGAREFGHWTMAFSRPESKDFSTLANQVEAAVISAGPNTRSLFESFAMAA